MDSTHVKRKMWVRGKWWRHWRSFCSWWRPLTGFSTELLLGRRLVWERIVYATFLPCIFCFAKRSIFLILKSRLGSITKLPLKNHLTVFGKFFETKSTNLKHIRLTFFTESSLKSRCGHILIRRLSRMFYFVEWIAWSVPVHKHLVLLTSSWVGNSYFDSFHQKQEKPTSMDWKLSKKIKRNSKIGSWILLRKLTKWLPKKVLLWVVKKKNPQPET